MAELATIRYGNERLTVDETASRLLPRLLHRLPIALWDTDETAETVQRDLCRALASELALWLEQLTIARQMTLLLEAEGVDLDRLLEDYGLHRYLGRPDAIARQIGMSMLWRPKSTMRALEHLADLLFDLPHTVVVTGTNEVHVFVAESQPLTMDTSYWMLTSKEGIRYAVTVKYGLGWISTRLPVGLDVTPPGHHFAGIQVDGDDSNTWYLTIEGDTMHCSLTPPDWGPSDGQGLEVLDGEGNLWTFGVLAGPDVLEPQLLSTLNPPIVVLDPAHPWQAVRLVDALGVPWWLWVWQGIAFLDPSLPPGATDVTPAEGPYRWLRLYGPDDALWYGYPVANFPGSEALWYVSQSNPGGLGTAAIQELGGPYGVNWRIGVTKAGTFGVSESPRVRYGGLTTALMLRDFDGHAWYWRIRQRGMMGVFEVSDVLWDDAVSLMPWGSIGWLSMLNTDGAIVYVYPQVNIGVPIVALGPPMTSPWGWSEPLQLQDQTGQLWDLSADAEALHYDTQAESDLEPRQPLIDLREVTDAFRHVRSAGTQVTVLVS
jgi:hypothetical protein